MKVKAAVFREIHQPLTIEDVDLADPGPDEVLVKTAACGVCHSDLHALHGAIPSPQPAIFGHEPAGVVLAVGSRVRNCEPGDHVIACTSIFCGECAQCVQALRSAREAIGWHNAIPRTLGSRVDESAGVLDVRLRDV